MSVTYLCDCGRREGIQPREVWGLGVPATPRHFSCDPGVISRHALSEGLPATRSPAETQRSQAGARGSLGGGWP